MQVFNTSFFRAPFNEEVMFKTLKGIKLYTLNLKMLIVVSSAKSSFGS